MRTVSSSWNKTEHAPKNKNQVNKITRPAKKNGTSRRGAGFQVPDRLSIQPGLWWPCPVRKQGSLTDGFCQRQRKQPKGPTSHRGTI